MFRKEHESKCVFSSCPTSIYKSANNTLNSLSLPTHHYLILAGDIGRLQDYDGLAQFLATQCERFERVFFVLGNHEFYGDR